MHSLRCAPILFIASLVGFACSGSGDKPGDAPTPPEPPLVTDERDDLLLSWFADGGAAVASSVAEVPAEVRAEVRVQDPQIPPERRDPDWIFLADLRQSDGAGRYPVRAQPREQYEMKRRQMLAAAAKASAVQPGAESSEPLQLIPNPDSVEAPVIMYGNRHCPVCRKARRWLLDQKIPYVEKDIEKDSTAAKNLAVKGKAQGVPITGVPIFDVGGRLIPGFDKAAIRKALSGVKPSPPTQGVI